MPSSSCKLLFPSSRKDMAKRYEICENEQRRNSGNCIDGLGTAKTWTALASVWCNGVIEKKISRLQTTSCPTGLICDIDSASSTSVPHGSIRIPGTKKRHWRFETGGETFDLFFFFFFFSRTNVVVARQRAHGQSTRHERQQWRLNALLIKHFFVTMGVGCICRSDQFWSRWKKKVDVKRNMQVCGCRGASRGTGEQGMARNQPPFRYTSAGGWGASDADKGRRVPRGNDWKVDEESGA
ncbi:hypothetical protein IWX47DRAFT_133224 [Phyllosticta citricarpa]